MIDLREHIGPVREWLAVGLTRFQAELPEVRAEHLALYCCPWAGWVSLCLDPKPQPEQNCPDFEFVELAMYEALDWVEEYEAHEGSMEIVDAKGERQSIAGGDEGLNRVFFDFLGELMADRTTMSAIGAVMRPRRLGVQLLDSQYSVSWEPKWL